MLGSERIIQLSDGMALTNKGRLFQYFNTNPGAVWYEVEMPDFNAAKKAKLTSGKTTFVEPTDFKNDFKTAKSLADLIK